MKTSYSYAIIKENYPELERESVLLDNKYKKSKKYAYICKVCHKDGSENIAFINYSNDLKELQERAIQLPSWYNYAIGIYKDMQGNINILNV
jgi:transposase-like protein